MSRHRGPRIRTKLLLLSLVLLTLPWLGYRYLQEMQNFLLGGQEKAQALMAQAIATVLHEREDLFQTATATPRSTRAQSLFYAFPLAQPIQLDGYADDWETLQRHALHFGSEAVQEIHDGATGTSLSFDLLLGVHEDALYAQLQVQDDVTVYRHPGYRRLDNSDQLRLSLIDPAGQTRRYLLLAEGPGTMTAYAMQANWKYADTGQPVPALRAYWQPTDQGYRLELRLPLDWLGPERQLHLALVDVDDAAQRTVASVVGTLPITEGAFNHVVLRSAELERILSSLERANARIWIVDRYQRVRAQVGSLQAYGLEDHGLDTDQRDETSVQQALQGHPALQRRPTLDGQGEMIMATHPILIGDEVLGAVVVEQSTADILALQRRTLERIGLITVAVLFIIISGLMLFASRLALRIRRLSRETHGAIASDGRVQHTRLDSDHRAGDEIGDLSRTISGLLERLARYTRFLEHMPRMLRHEIHNPLNVISTSLQNLSPQQDGQEQQRYRDSAQRGVARISAIVQTLTEAASLEEALRHEEREAVDLQALLTHYTESCRLQHPQRRFELQTDGTALPVLANDFRIEQLLDKLIANAVDFSPVDSTIHLQLQRDHEQACLEIRNTGHALPDEIRDSLFDSMVTRREAGQDQAHHLGMGLYVVRLIAEHAGGRVQAENAGEPEGVIIRVWLPEWSGDNGTARNIGVD